jgi:acyl-CoA thioesterase FadM
MHGARATRRTTIRLCEGGALVAEIVTEWVWVRVPEGRPSRIPEDIVAAFTSQGK